jgi:FlaA1/EpsC-like NDP-sugar epimerase
MLTSGLSLLIAAFLPPVTIPRSIPIIFLLLALVATAAPRLLARFDTIRQRKRARMSRVSPVLIVGAGDAGRLTAREFQQNPQLGMEVVGFLDDDLAKQALQIHGIPVLGTRYDLPLVVKRLQIEQVIIAMPVAPGKVIRELVATCEQVGVQTKILPGIYDLLGGKVGVTALRNVQIEDLLRRTPVQTDTAAVSTLLRGKRVLVSGGGGSIGSELCRQVLRCAPAELIVLGHGENSVFEIQNELQRLVAKQGVEAPRIHGVIADIRFAERIEMLFEEYRPEVVFHAAAHKHVPLMEANPAEGITNNVLGTRNLLRAARQVEVEHFVMISTDKAVNPTSVMGACKRVAELLVHEAARATGKPYVAVRFGNVLGSRGSVVLTFRQQIAAGGPVTVTDPEMRRYFMTIPEAVQLVLQAAVLGRGGEVFVLDMGEPVKIADLARDMVELSGLEVERDIDIVFTGLRPGEKLFEELFVEGEVYHRTRHEKIFIAGNASVLVPTTLEEGLVVLAEAAEHNDHEAIRDGLRRLVPEYRPTFQPRPAEQIATRSLPRV